MTKLIRVNPPAYSESGMLKEMGQLLRKVRVADDASHQVVKEIAFMIGLLASQARMGVHANPPEGRLTNLGVLLKAKNDVNGNPRKAIVVIDTLDGSLRYLDTDRAKPSEVRMVMELHVEPGDVRIAKSLIPYTATNPPSRAGRKFISQKIALLAHEGVPSPKRIAEAYAIARQRGFRGISLSRPSKSRRLRHNPAQLAVLGLNPPPRIDQSVDPIVALWGEFHYVRPDDPEGEVVRVHEFENGFVAVPLIDGRVLLESRRGERLWTAQ